MFADTLTLTVNAVAKNLIRVNQDKYSSEYFLRESAGEYRLFIRNTSYSDKKRGVIERHNIEFVQTIYAVAPAVEPKIRKIYTVFEVPQGDDLVLSVKHSAAMVAFLTEVNLTKMANWES